MIQSTFFYLDSFEEKQAQMQVQLIFYVMYKL